MFSSLGFLSTGYNILVTYLLLRSVDLAFLWCEDLDLDDFNQVAQLAKRHNNADQRRITHLTIKMRHSNHVQ